MNGKDIETTEGNTLKHNIDNSSLQFVVNGTNSCRSLAIEIMSPEGSLGSVKARRGSDTIDATIIKEISEEEFGDDQTYYYSRWQRGQFTYRPDTNTSIEQLCLELNLFSAQLADTVRIVLDVSYRLGFDAFEQSIGHFAADTEVLHLCLGDHLSIKATNYSIIVRHYVYDLDGDNVPNIIFTANQFDSAKDTDGDRKSKHMDNGEEEDKAKLKINWNEDNVDFENYFRQEKGLITFTTGMMCMSWLSLLMTNTFS